MQNLPYTEDLYDASYVTSNICSMPEPFEFLRTTKKEPETYYVGDEDYYNNMNTDEPYSNHTMSTYLQGETL